MPAPHDAKLREELTQTASSLNGSYGKGKYCPGHRLQAELPRHRRSRRTHRKIRDPKDLEAMWVGWHKVGAPMRDRYAASSSSPIRARGNSAFADTGALWRSGYDMTPEQFARRTDRLWKQVEPLYEELHCYVRAQAQRRNTATRCSAKTGPIRADLLGNMWAQEWGNIYDIVAPPGAGDLGYDIGDAAAARKSYDPIRMVKAGEGFYHSLGFAAAARDLLGALADHQARATAKWSATPAPGTSTIRTICASRCASKVNADDFVTDPPRARPQSTTSAPTRSSRSSMRNGANDGFHEAIGDSIALSITPEYLVQIGLLDPAKVPSADKDIGAAAAPGDGQGRVPAVRPADRQMALGACSPARSSRPTTTRRGGTAAPAISGHRAAGAIATEADFDPGAKYHIPANTPYTRYFLARMLQFQFYRASAAPPARRGRCTAAPSTATRRRATSSKPCWRWASKPWPEALKAMTGEDHIDASAMVEYFQPLLAWLKEQNASEKPGWTVGADPLKAH